MQFSSNVKRGVLKLGDKQESYRLSVQFYLQPPTENISLMEFESFACDRLKLLKAVENLGVSYVKGDASYQDKLESELRHLKFPYRALTEDDYDARRKDHISHFILRLAYCQSEELKRWFIQQEMDLFRYRFNQLSHSLVEKFLQYANLGYDIICTRIFHYIHTEFGMHSDISNAVQSTLVILKEEDNVLNSQLEELMLCVFVTDKVDKEGGRINRVAGNADLPETEKLNMENKLIDANPGINELKNNVFYKVPFCDAADLVRVRKVYLLVGYACVPQQEFVTIVLNSYRTKLSKALALTARSLPMIQTDERLQPLLNNLSHAYVGPDYNIENAMGKISLEQIDALSVKSFPLCMRQLHKALRDNHHLRHGGRMQYGLFLKGIGLTLEQALQFWKSEFIRGKVDADKFDKGYVYNIRHSYGKEGKRTDYTPYSCMKIILSNLPGQGDYHGCPFRHSDPELLKQKLQSYKIPPSGIGQILDLVKGMHYQLACQKYFELTHDVKEIGFSLSHPNQYFIESQQLLGVTKEIKKDERQLESAQLKHSSRTPADIPTTSSLSATEEMELEGLEDYFADD